MCINHETARSLFTLFALAAVTLLAGCGGGKTAIVGFGNSGNHMMDAEGLAEDIADAFQQTGAAAPVSDALLRELFEGVVARARAGDSEASLVVLKVAELQRSVEED